MKLEKIKALLNGENSLEKLEETLEVLDFSKGPEWECYSYETGQSALDVFLDRDEYDEDNQEVPENLIMFTAELYNDGEGSSAHQFLVFNTETKELTDMVFEQWDEGDCSLIKVMEKIQL